MRFFTSSNLASNSVNKLLNTIAEQFKITPFSTPEIALKKMKTLVDSMELEEYDQY